MTKKHEDKYIRRLSDLKMEDWGEDQSKIDELFNSASEALLESGLPVNVNKVDEADLTVDAYKRMLAVTAGYQGLEAIVHTDVLILQENDGLDTEEALVKLIKKYKNFKL